jgi:hypothetical protein
VRSVESLRTKSLKMTRRSQTLTDVMAVVVAVVVIVVIDVRVVVVAVDVTVIPEADAAEIVTIAVDDVIEMIRLEMMTIDSHHTLARMTTVQSHDEEVAEVRTATEEIVVTEASVEKDVVDVSASHVSL